MRLGQTKEEANHKQCFLVRDSGRRSRQTRPYESTRGQVESGSNAGEDHAGWDLPDHVSGRQDRNSRVEIVSDESEIFFESAEARLSVVIKGISIKSDNG